MSTLIETSSFTRRDEKWFALVGPRARRALAPIGDPIADRWFRVEIATAPRVRSSV